MNLYPMLPLVVILVYWVFFDLSYAFLKLTFDVVYFSLYISHQVLSFFMSAYLF